MATNKVLDFLVEKASVDLDELSSDFTHGKPTHEEVLEFADQVATRFSEGSGLCIEAYDDKEAQNVGFRWNEAAQGAINVSKMTSFIGAELTDSSDLVSGNLSEEEIQEACEALADKYGSETRPTMG